MATTLLTLRTLTRALVGDPLEESNSWSDAEVDAAVNFSILNYCEKTDCTYTEEPISFGGGSAFVPAPYIRIERVLIGSAALYWSSKDFEDQRDLGWRLLVGTPKRFHLQDGNTIRIVPASDDTGTLGYIAKPDDLVLDADEVTAKIPEPHHPYLKYAAAAWLYSKDGDQMDLKKAQEFMQTFNNLIGVAGSVEPVETKE